MAFIDAIIIYLGGGFVLAPLYALGVALEHAGVEDGPLFNEWVLVSIALAMVATWWIGYLGVSNGRGASAGKQLPGLRVVDGNGNKIGTMRGLTRAVMSLLFVATAMVIIDFAWTLFDLKNRTLHDRLVGSYVVSRSA